MRPGFICKHVSAGAPILSAVRDEPIDEIDSGWSLLCGRPDHAYEDYLTVNLDRYESRDATLVEVLDLPPYTVCVRTQHGQPWVIETHDLPVEMSN